MFISSIVESNIDPVANGGASGPIVLSSRIRLARNLAHFPFPGWAQTSQQNDILARCLEALAQLPQLRKGTAFKMQDLTELDRQILMERHLISRELQNSKLQSGVYLARDATCAVMINEEDHLRIQMLRGGLKLKQLWKSINELDSNLEDTLDFAFTLDLGYLTACPTNVGTGMRASCMLHLPALVLAGHMEKVIRMVNQVGIAVRGLFGEGTDATGSIFQISNQQTLGESEEDILKRLHNILTAVIQQEQNARLKLIEDSRSKLFDKIGRAFGVLSQAHVVSSEEAMNLLSLIRLAVDLGILPDGNRPLVDQLFLEVQPGHVQFKAKQSAEAGQRDMIRARHVRVALQKFPPLDFTVKLDSGDGPTEKSE